MKEDTFYKCFMFWIKSAPSNVSRFFFLSVWVAPGLFYEFYLSANVRPFVLLENRKKEEGMARKRWHSMPLNRSKMTIFKNLPISGESKMIQQLQISPNERLESP